MPPKDSQDHRREKSETRLSRIDRIPRLVSQPQVFVNDG
jgi:hypothetical protein